MMKMKHLFISEENTCELHESRRTSSSHCKNTHILCLKKQSPDKTHACNLVAMWPQCELMVFMVRYNSKRLGVLPE